jgi:hypothetical protein
MPPTSDQMGLYQYHVQHVKALQPQDYPACLWFCQWIAAHCHLHKYVLFIGWIFDAVSLEITWLDHLQLRIIWLWIIIFLQNFLPLFIQDIYLQTRLRMSFQHDGVPSHVSWQVTEYLNHQCPNYWIGCFGLQAWPARSCDLMPLDYLWGHTKDMVCQHK